MILKRRIRRNDVIFNKVVISNYPVELAGESGGSGSKNTFFKASKTVIPSVKTL